MNTLKSHIGENPFGESEEFARFTIDDISTPFTLHNIAVPGQEYTLGFWVKSPSDSRLTIQGNPLPVVTNWVRHVITFNANEADLKIFFTKVGTYYIYRPKLELGNKDTDWTPAVEDMATGESVDVVDDNLKETDKKLEDTNLTVNEIKSQIEILEKSIAMLVTDENGASLMTQTSDGGWTFDISGLQSNLGNASGTLATLIETVNSLSNITGGLESAVKNLETTSEYVWITTYEDEPCLALGESDSDFGLFITNTRIIFIDGSGDPTQISKDGLYSNKIEAGSEFRQKGFVWAVRSNGNYGLSWKGVR